MTSAEIEDAVMGELFLSYRPMVTAAVEYFNGTNNTDSAASGSSWSGFAVTEKSEKFEVRALALGVVIKAIQNIDSFRGTFEATLKLFFFNVTTDVAFSTIGQAMNTIYKQTSRTVLKRSNSRNTNYYRLHADEMPGARSREVLPDGDGSERVHPDGLCSPEIVSKIKPIKADGFDFENVLRLPGRNARVIPSIVTDSEGNLSWIELASVPFKYKPANRQFFPVQTDLLDLHFEMGTTHLIDEDQRIVKHLLCFHPAFSGFATHTFGADRDAGHTTSDTFTMVPYLEFDRTEPFLREDLDQFNYGIDRQRSRYGIGSELTRMLGLRIIAEHPRGRGIYKLLPVLIVSLTAVLNLLSKAPTDFSGTSWIQVSIGINSLVTLDNQYIGIQTIWGQALILAYTLNFLWILTIVLMMLINRAKEGDQSEGERWYIRYQSKIYQYLVMAAVSILLLYFPLIHVYEVDKSYGSQSNANWLWWLVVGLIAFMFIVRVVLDCRECAQDEETRHADSVKEFSDIYKFSNKPLNRWDEDEVLRWVRIGSMHRDSYFSETKRSSITDKFAQADVDGELLCQFGMDVDKLVQFVGLSFGDAVKLAEEVKLLLENNTESDAITVQSATAVGVSNCSWP